MLYGLVFGEILNRFIVFWREFEFCGDAFRVVTSLGFGVSGEGIAGGGAGKCRVSGDGERSDGGKYLLRVVLGVMLVRESRLWK
jgi:hypothetical protein